MKKSVEEWGIYANGTLSGQQKSDSLVADGLSQGNAAGLTARDAIENRLNEPRQIPNRKQQSISLIAKEISTAARYFDKVVQCYPLANDSGQLLREISCDQKIVANTEGDVACATSDPNVCIMLLLNGNLNFSRDIQGTLNRFKLLLNRSSRVCVVLYNPYFEYVYHLASLLGMRTKEIPSTYLTEPDLLTFARLSGFEVVRSRPCVFFPWKWFGIGAALNCLIALLFFMRWMCLAWIVSLRPVNACCNHPSLSVIVPVRNERGNIENVVKRLPPLSPVTEVVFVEGHSTDGTWEEIQRVSECCKVTHTIRAYQQQGKGKCDAVRLGCEKASNELLVILDADLSVPPESLVRFYEAFTVGLGDFINGSRLVYPLEGNAMKFLNRLGNMFFAKALSHVLDSRLTDTLCGTKMLLASDYKRVVKWRRDFGDFDPFGDFELLFGASVLALGIVSVPIWYKARTYGTTNISRFRDGLVLLRMTLVGLLRIKL